MPGDPLTFVADITTATELEQVADRGPRGRGGQRRRRLVPLPHPRSASTSSRPSRRRRSTTSAPISGRSSTCSPTSALAGLELPNLLGDIPGDRRPDAAAARGAGGRESRPRTAARPARRPRGACSPDAAVVARHAAARAPDRRAAIADLPAGRRARARRRRRRTAGDRLARRRRARRCAALGERAGPAADRRAAGRRRRSTSPTRSSTSPGEDVPLLSSEPADVCSSRTARVVRAAGDDMPPFAATDLLVRRRRDDVHPGPPGPAGRPGAARHRVGRARPSRRRCRRPARSSSATSSGSGRSRVERFTATRALDVAHGDADAARGADRGGRTRSDRADVADRQRASARSSPSPCRRRRRSPGCQPPTAPGASPTASTSSASSRVIRTSGGPIRRSTSIADPTSPRQSDRDRGN